MDRIAVMLVMGIIAVITLNLDPKPVHKINGVSLVASRDSTDNTILKTMNHDGIAWVAVIPYAFTQSGNPQLIFNSERQWWGEGIEGIRQSIQASHASGMKVMVKPHVWIRDEGWPGEYNLANDSLWTLWESYYSAYILAFAEAAEMEKAEIFCIGTEFRIAARERPEFWRQLVRHVKSVYSGKVTYAANWDNYDKIVFWDELDFIGIDAYFPLSESRQPTIDELTAGWNKLAKPLSHFSEKYNRPILLTEFGYRSTEFTADGHWKYKLEDLNSDNKAQENAYAALFDSIWQEHYIAGGFLWKWHLSLPHRPGSMDKSYSPQGKSAQDVIRKQYTSN